MEITLKKWFSCFSSNYAQTVFLGILCDSNKHLCSDEVTWLSRWCIRQQCRGTGCNQWRHCTEDLYRVSSRTSGQGRPDRPSAFPVQRPEKQMVNCVSHCHSKIVQKWHSLTFNNCICSNQFTCVALSSVSSRLFSHTLAPRFPFFISWTCTEK